MTEETPGIGFWEDANRRADEIRVKAQVLVETMLGMGETGLAKDWNNLAGLCLTQMSVYSDRIRVLKIREARAKGQTSPYVSDAGKPLNMAALVKKVDKASDTIIRNAPSAEDEEARERE